MSYFFIDISVENMIRSSFILYKAQRTPLNLWKDILPVISVIFLANAWKYAKKALTNLIRSSHEDSPTPSPLASAMRLGQILLKSHIFRTHATARYTAATMWPTKPPNHTQWPTSSHCHTLTILAPQAAPQHFRGSIIRLLAQLKFTNTTGLLPSSWQAHLLKAGLERSH